MQKSFSAYMRKHLNVWAERVTVPCGVCSTLSSFLFQENGPAQSAEEGTSLRWGVWRTGSLYLAVVAVGQKNQGFLETVLQWLWCAQSRSAQQMGVNKAKGPWYEGTHSQLWITAQLLGCAAPCPAGTVISTASWRKKKERLVKEPSFSNSSS